MIKLSTGETLGSYRVRSFLGRGAFAHIYLATDTKNELVALKVGDIAGGGSYMKRFLDVTNDHRPDGISPDETPAEAIRFEKDGAHITFLDASEINSMIRGECELLRHIHHWNIVGVRGMFLHEGRNVLVMDYVRGKTLREKFRALEGVRLNWFLTIVRALQSLNASGDLPYHGDLKPENVLIKPSGGVVVIDPAMRENEQNVITTTPHYNPLLLRNSKADVMGIGVMLYEILTGVLPFDEVPWQYAGREQGGEVQQLSLSYFLSYPPPSDLNPNTPESLETIIYRCLTVMDYGLAALEMDLVEYLRMD
ncbi:MAG: protein kinase [Patescibacteria group bacterium]